jgi:hypothetical protein
MRCINENLPQDVRILFFYMGNRGYYCDRDYVFDMQKGVSTFWEIVKRAHSPDAIVSELRKMGITHLLIRYDIFKRWVETDFKDRERKLVYQFFKKYVTQVFFRWGYGVSRLEELPQL